MLNKIKKIIPNSLGSKYGIYCGTNTLKEFLTSFKYLFKLENDSISQKKIKVFEKKFSQKSKFKYSISYGSGRMALFSILKAINIKKNDEIILPAFTCAVVPNSIIYSGAKPIYVDIRSDNFNINTDLIEKKITKKTKVIYAQHTFGLKCNLKKIFQLAKKYNLKVIEDSAHCFDLNKKGYSKSIATYYSLDHSKVINTHLGGVAATDNKEIYKKMISRKNFKLNKFVKKQIILSFIIEYILFHKYILWIGKSAQIILNYFKIIFYFRDELKINKPYYYPCNYTSFQAYLGISQIQNIRKNLGHRLKIANIIQKKINWYDVNNQEFKKCSWLRYSFLVKDRKKFEKIFGKFFDLDIWYKNLFEGREKKLHEIKYRKNSCPIAEYVSKHIVNLPTHLKIPPELIEETINKNWYWLKNDINYKFKNKEVRKYR